MKTVVILIIVMILTAIIIYPLIQEGIHHEQGNEARVNIG
jgi:preprotein translocase subunit SecG